MSNKAIEKEEEKDRELKEKLSTLYQEHITLLYKLEAMEKLLDAYNIKYKFTKEEAILRYARGEEVVQI